MNPATSKPTLPPWLKITLTGSAALFLTLVVLGFTAIAVLRTDPAKLEIVLEVVASKILNRELRIGQLVAAELDWDTYLLAHDVSLANPDWAETPDFISVERFLMRINLPSIWRDGPIIIDELELTGARLSLIAPADSPPNWEFWPAEDSGEIIQTSEGEQDDEFEGVLPILIGNGHIRQGEISYQDPVRDVVVIIERLNILEPRQDGLIAIDLAGVFNEIPLDVSGHIGPASALLTQRNLDLDLQVNWGEFTVEARGAIGDLADLSGLSLDLKIIAPHSRPLLDVLGIPEIRDGPVYLEAQISDAHPGLIVDVEGTFNKFNLQLSGKLANPQALDGVDIAFTLGGFSLAEDAALLGLPGLPPIPYEVSGEVYREGSMLGVRKGQIVAGDGSLAIEGFLPEFPEIDDWRVTVVGSSVNLALISPLMGTEGLPVIPYNIDLELDSTIGGVERVHLRIHSPQSSLTLNGNVGQAPEYLGSSLKFNLSGNDLASSGLWLGIPNLPPLTFTLDGELSMSDLGWQVTNANFLTSDLHLGLSGEVDTLFEPTHLKADIQLSSPNLSATLKSYGWDVQPLPGFPVAVTGRLSGSPNNLEIEQLVVESGESRMTVSGILGDPASLASLNLDVSLTTPDIFRFLPLMGDGLQPRLPLEASGKVMMSSAGIIVEDVAGNLGETQIKLTALLNPADLHDNSRITIDARSADLGKVLEPWINQDVPNTPFHMSLDASYQSGSLRVERLDAEVADNRLTAQIDFDDPEDLTSAHGKIQLTGPSSNSLAHLLGVDAMLADAEYSLAINVWKSSDFLHLNPISLSWGRSDLSGSMTIRPGDVPTINADLYSKILDLSFVLPNMQELAQEEAASARAGDKFDEEILFEELTKQELAERVVPGKPLDFSWIRNLRASLKYQVDEIYLRAGATARATIDVSIANGLLSSRKLRWDGKYSAGNAEVSLRVLEATNEIEAYFDVQRLPLLLIMGGEPSYQPDSFYRARISATGNSLQEMAQNANGALIFKGAGGRLDNKGLDLILGDVMDEIISRLNPYSETDAHTQVVCHAGAITIKDGQILVAPGMVVRGNKMDIVTRGTVNLHNEKLDLTFNTRSRRGIGISASKAVTPYFKIGGTLANPRLALDVKGATVSGSAAVATAGMSILAHGLWDRWIATAKNPCDRLIEVASKQNNKIYESLLAVPAL